MLPGFSIIITPDGLKVYLQIPSESVAFPNAVELRHELSRLGVVCGINENILLNLSNCDIQNGFIEIAKGVAPIDGVPGRIEMLIDISGVGKPKELQDGRVDHHEIGTVINVKKGTPLARKIPPEEGVDGRNVFGKPVSASPPIDILLRSGSGTCISSDNSNLLIADVDGALSIGPEGIIEVKNYRIIESDIDYSTGNINFSGDLFIRGSVRAGFFVEVNGNLHIQGNVEDTKIIVNGDIKVEGGAVGAGTGLIKSTGTINVRHIENFFIESGCDVNISEDCLHSTITSDGKIKCKSIIGSSITAFIVECECIGSSAEAKTIIDIGRMNALKEEYTRLVKQKSQILEEIERSKIQMFEFVRDSMGEDGKLSLQNENKLELLKDNTIKYKKLSNIISKRIDALNRREESIGNRAGVYAKRVFPNTMIKIGNSEHQIYEILNNVNFAVGNNNEYQKSQ